MDNQASKPSQHLAADDGSSRTRMNDHHSEFLLEGVGVPRAVLTFRGDGAIRRVVANRSGHFAVRLGAGSYTVEEVDGARTLILGPDGEPQWTVTHQRSPERVPGFAIVAGDPIWPGGVERWMEHLVQIQDPPCLGVAFGRVTAASYGAQACLAMLRQHVPVEVGVDAVERLCRRAAVLVDWRCPDLPRLLPSCRALRPRIVRVSHSPPECAWARRYHAETADYTDTWVAVSASAVQCVPRTVREILVIPNAVASVPAPEELDEPMQRAAAQWGLESTEPKLACLLTRFGREKRPDFGLTLARALPQDWKVLIAGLGYEFDRLAGEVMRDSSLRGRVLMPGAVDPWTAIALSRAVIVPSQYESFCRVIAEAWLLGKPVAATPVGLAAEHPEWAYPIGSGCTLDDAIDVAAWLERGAPWSHDLTLAAQQHVQNHYGLEPFLKSWSALLCREVARACRSDPLPPPERQPELKGIEA